MPIGTCVRTGGGQTAQRAEKVFFFRGCAEMKMLKKLVLVGALIAAMPAMAQEEISIDGKDFLSGAGDARLAEVAKQAAATGKKVVVTAPAYWQDKVNAKLHAGAANAAVQIKEGFFENVIVRLEDNKPVAAKAAEAPAPAA